MSWWRNIVGVLDTRWPNMDRFQLTNLLHFFNKCYRWQLLCYRRCLVIGSVVTTLLLGVLAADNDTEVDSMLELEPMVITGGWHPGSECTCYNSTETERVHHMEPEPECRCRGAAFTDIPANISSYMRRLWVPTVYILCISVALKGILRNGIRIRLFILWNYNVVSS
jgi:hypothetical protein